MLSAILVAGGKSRRAGFDKLLACLAGRTVIDYSISAFESAQCVDEIILVVRETGVASLRALMRRFRKLRAVVQGGERRQDSVQAGLNAVSKPDFIAVHDAARPLITAKEIERVFAVAVAYGAAALAAPVGETLKIADPSHRVI